MGDQIGQSLWRQIGDESLGHGRDRQSLPLVNRALRQVALSPVRSCLLGCVSRDRVAPHFVDFSNST